MIVFRGTDEHYGLLGKPFMITGSLSKAIGLGSGGYVTGPHTAIELFRQVARGYVFTVSAEPAICEAALKVSF